MLLARGKRLWNTTDFLILDRNGLRAELTFDSRFKFKLRVDTQEYLIAWTPIGMESEEGVYGERLVSLSKADTLILAAYGHRQGRKLKEYHVAFADIVYSVRNPWFAPYTVRVEDRAVGTIEFRSWDLKRRFLIDLPSELPLLLQIFLFHVVCSWCGAI
jgi:hypothetical protein